MPSGVALSIAARPPVSRTSIAKRPGDCLPDLSLVKSRTREAGAGSRPGFKHHVERALRRPADTGKTGLGYDVAYFGFTGLGAEPFSDLLIQRCRHANHGRC